MMGVATVLPNRIKTPGTPRENIAYNGKVPAKSRGGSLESTGTVDPDIQESDVQESDVLPSQDHRPRWSPAMLQKAERANDRLSFAEILLYFTDEVQRYLIRHSEAMDRTFPNFTGYLQYRMIHSPFFAKRWKSLWRQRVRWANKPSLRAKAYISLTP